MPALYRLGIHTTESTLPQRCVTTLKALGLLCVIAGVTVAGAAVYLCGGSRRFTSFLERYAVPDESDCY